MREVEILNRTELVIVEIQVGQGSQCKQSLGTWQKVLS